MPPSSRLRRLFLEGFTVEDVAEELCAFDAESTCSEVAAFMDARGFDLIGVRRSQRVEGFAERAALTSGCLGDHVQPFTPDDLVGPAASLAETIRSLELNGRCFAPVGDRVALIVTVRDLEKAPVRMWLFGMITVLEMRITERVRADVPETEWLAELTAVRRAAAEALQAERMRRGQPTDLVDCLQLGDKTRILLKRPGTAERWGMRSTREAKQTVKDLQQLRNNLAHMQTFIDADWRTVVRLANAVETIGDRI